MDIVCLSIKHTDEFITARPHLDEEKHQLNFSRGQEHFPGVTTLGASCCSSATWYELARMGCATVAPRASGSVFPSERLQPRESGAR